MRKERRTQVTLLHHHLRQLHMSIDVVWRALQHIVQPIAIRLLKHFEEAELSGPVFPRVVESVPLALVRVRLGSIVA